MSKELDQGFGIGCGIALGFCFISMILTILPIVGCGACMIVGTGVGTMGGAAALKSIDDAPEPPAAPDFPTAGMTQAEIRELCGEAGYLIDITNGVKWYRFDWEGTKLTIGIDRDTKTATEVIVATH